MTQPSPYPEHEFTDIEHERLYACSRFVYQGQVQQAQEIRDLKGSIDTLSDKLPTAFARQDEKCRERTHRNREDIDAVGKQMRDTRSWVKGALWVCGAIVAVTSVVATIITIIKG